MKPTWRTIWTKSGLGSGRTEIPIAALKAKYLTREDVPEDIVANERRIAEETARNEGKPEQAPTPTRARFEKAGFRSEMPVQAWAPLDEEAGAAELTARLEQVLGDALPENLERGSSRK